MADTGIFATTSEVQAKVGANASTTYNAEAYINQFMTEIESLINTETGVNFSDLYTSLNADVKGILKLAASNHAAMMVWNADPSGIPAREYETKLDVLRDGFTKAMGLLKDKLATDFIQGA